MKFPAFFAPLTGCEANIIWPRSCGREIDVYALFRKSFSHNGGSCQLRIFADTYYNLYVDGSFLHRGPVRRHEAHAEFDTLTLQLAPGSHTVAVLVHHLGVECAAHRKGSKAFWCEIETAGGKLVTDAGWKALYCDAFATDGRIFTHYDFCEDVDMRVFPTGWQAPEFDDSGWPAAEVICPAASDADVHQNYTARTLKLFSYPVETAAIIRTGTYTETLDPEEPFAKRFFARSRDTAQPGGSYAIGELRATVSGCARIDYETNADAEIIITYDDDADETGMIRPGRMGRCADRFLVGPGSGTVQVFMPRGFRYILAEISGGGSIRTIRAEKEEYPYEEKKGFSAGLNWWSDLYDQSVRTQ